jgi:hypothetical protein
MQTAGVINVAANVAVGADVVSGSTGTLTISGGEMNVGVTSPTGGDLVLGSNPFSSGTVNLQGGTLDVSNGTGKIGASMGTVAFNFTGGTLKVNVFNTGDFGGSIGDLVQNGSGSLLDVTGNDTIIGSNYDLGEGTATIGGGRSLNTIAVVNSFGAGVINVGDGGAAATLSVGAGTIGVDTLNLDNGDVVASLATVDTELSGSGSFSDDLTLGSASTLSMAIDGSSDFDLIDVANMFTITAGAQLDIAVGFTPGANEMFDILDFGSIAGTFSSVNFSTGTWDTSNLYTTGVVTYLSAGAGAGAAVPEPATWSLMAIALAGLFGARSVRNRRK